MGHKFLIVNWPDPFLWDAYKLLKKSQLCKTIGCYDGAWSAAALISYIHQSATDKHPLMFVNIWIIAVKDGNFIKKLEA